MKTTLGQKTTSLKVKADVVKHLSLGLYRNFALAIKELISNAYDADATEVKIKLDLDKGLIVIRDNGRGMSEEEFTKDYLTVAKVKVPSKKPDELGRVQIGTFGVGFLSPLPYCKNLRIITKKVGQEFVLESLIPADDFFLKGNWELKEHKIKYEIRESDLPIEVGETIIILEEIKDHVKTELSKELRVRRTVEGSGYELFKWTLAQYCPIEFPPERDDLTEFFKPKGIVPMKLWLDGERLYRNVPDQAKILEKETKVFGNIKLKYVIMTSYDPVQPEEMRGLQVRLRDVAIGYPRDFDVTKQSHVLGKLNMLCGEVHVLEGLENALLVNRDSFNFTEDVSVMNNFFQDRLRYWNDQLEKTSISDKAVYLALGNLRNDERILDSLKKSNATQFSSTRLRLSTSSLQKSKNDFIENSVDQIAKALSKKIDDPNKIIRKKGNVDPSEPAIQYEEKTDSLIIYEDHPEFLESIEYEGKNYLVRYGQWDPSNTPYKICRLADDNSAVEFNKSHPLFQSKLNDTIVKKLALGILIIVNENEDKESLLNNLINLVEDVFVG